MYTESAIPSIKRSFIEQILFVAGNSTHLPFVVTEDVDASVGRFRNLIQTAEDSEIRLMF